MHATQVKDEIIKYLFWKIMEILLIITGGI